MRKLSSIFQLFNKNNQYKGKISVSILSATDREKSVLKLNHTNIDYIHLDVMDGQFVKNVSLSISEINKIVSLSNKKIDIHFMVNDPVSYLKEISSKNISYVTFHLELDQDIDYIIDVIRKKGYSVGVAISPDTSIESIFPYLNKIDLVLVMSVIPGMGGQEFIEESLNRIQMLKEKIQELNTNVVIQVDGGIKDYNIFSVIEAGADVVVVGSFVVNSDYYVKSIKCLRENMNKKKRLLKKVILWFIIFFCIYPILYIIFDLVKVFFVGVSDGSYYGFDAVLFRICNFWMDIFIFFLPILFYFLVVFFIVFICFLVRFFLKK